MQHSQPSTITSSLYDYMEELMEKRNSVAPPGVAKGYHCDGGVFTWMLTQQGLVQNVFSGLAICFPAAFIVLLLATHNVYLALLAITTVAGNLLHSMCLCIVPLILQSFDEETLPFE